MKHFIKLLTISLLFPLFSNAQSNYKPGYVVTLKGDTLKGFIDYREWDANPGSIDFKRSPEETGVNKFTPENASYFSITNLESYRRYEGPISTDPVADVNLNRDTSFRMGTVFLKVIEKGDKLALYSYKDDIKQRFFIGEQPDYSPHELIFRVYGANTEYTYRKQLSAQAQINGELDQDMIVTIGRAEYDQDDILDIVSRINHISKADYAKSHYSGSAIDFFAGLGVNMQNTSTSASTVYYSSGGTGSTSIKPAIFFGMNLFANPATKALQFRLELSASQGSFKSLYTLKTYPYKPTEASFNTTNFAVSPEVIYNFYNSDNLKVFAGAGISILFSSYSNSYFGTQNHDGSESDIAANDPYAFNNQNTTFLGTVGVEFDKHIQIFANYQGSIPVTKGGYFGLSSSAIQAGVVYLINLK